MSSSGKNADGPHVGSRPVGRPPGATGQRTREEILEAALEAFAAAGYEAMSVRELTRRLSVSHNLVHHHFGSKPELWRAAVEHGVGGTIREFSELLDQGIGGPSPAKTLRTGLLRAINLLAIHPAVARIVADEAGRGGERLDYIYDQFVRPGMETLELFLVGAQGRGVREIDPRVLALFVASVASVPFTHGALAEKLGVPVPRPAGSTVSVEGYAETLVELMLGGLIAPAGIATSR